MASCDPMTPRTPEERERACEWTADGGLYRTSCGYRAQAPYVWQMGKTTSMSANFCPGCGGKIVQTARAAAGYPVLIAPKGEK